MWATVLEIAGGDPLRAQEMEARLTERWWDRYQADAKARNEAKEAKGSNG